jgi:integrase
MIAVAIYCGLRKGELFGLRWIDVHLDAVRLDVNRSYRGLPKNGKPRHLPMHPDLVKILRPWQERCPRVEGLVFPVEAEAERFRMGSKEDMLELPALLAAAVHA